jgi:uncharacterized membrane protein YkoI
MRSQLLTILGVLSLAALTPSPARAQAVGPPPTVKVKAARPAYLKEATLSSDSALALARTRVPGGQVREAELEREQGRLVYSFDLAVSGKTGIEEVLVDARTGEIVEVSHESPADEARERKAETKPKAPPR